LVPRKVLRSEAIDLAKKYNMLYVECSAMKRVNVDDLFRNLVMRIVKNEQGLVGDGPGVDKKKCLVQ
jgi:hypothetical protein